MESRDHREEVERDISKTLKLTFFRAIFLAVITIIVGILTSSLLVITEAVDSCMDISAALITLITVRKSFKPPDEKHPYGHGKFASLGGVIEGLLILLTSIFISVIAIYRIMEGAVEVRHSWLGLITIGVAVVINLLVYFRIRRVNIDIKLTALSGEALNILGDIFKSLSIFIGLAIVMWTRFWLIDSILAIAISLFLIVNAVRIIKKALGWLLDRRISDEEMERLNELLGREERIVLGFHNLMTTRNGPYIEVDVHLDVCAKEEIYEVHVVMERYELSIRKEFKGASIMIHPEPCEQYPYDCDGDDCPLG